MTPAGVRGRPRVLAIIQAGGAGSRMDVLTREVPKPALPFAGAFRLIDFPLSNLHNSGISDVWVSVQYLGQHIADAIGNGKPWDLDRHRGGLKLVIPQEGTGPAATEGFVSGNAEELLANRDAIRTFGADAVVVMSADHVYRLDYSKVVEEHLAHEAECTVVTTEVGLADASHHATVEVDRDGRVTGLAYKPDKPSTPTVATEVFVYAPGPLIQVLEGLHRELSTDPGNVDDEDGNALGDFGEHLLPTLIERGRVWAYPLPGYWRDLGRPEVYVAAHRELLHTDVDLFTPDWPITTNNPVHLPARVHASGTVTDSLLSAGCMVAGTVRDSVLGRGVHVAENAVVADCILFDDVVVEAGARLDWAVVDSGTRVGSDAKVGAKNPGGEASAEALTVVGRDCTIAPGAQVERGARLEPGTTV